MTTVLKKTQPVVEGNHKQGLSTLNFNSPTNANVSWRPDLEKNGGWGEGGGDPLVIFELKIPFLFC